MASERTGSGVDPTDLGGEGHGAVEPGKAGAHQGGGRPLGLLGINRVPGEGCFETWCLRGLGEPQLLVVDGNEGVWVVAVQVWRAAEVQRWWNHEMRSIPNRLPKREQKEAKDLLRFVADAPSEAEVVEAREAFRKGYKGMEHATALVWKLLSVAEKRFRNPKAPQQLKDLFEGRKFEDEKAVSDHQLEEAV